MTTNLNLNEFLASADWQDIGQGNQRTTVELKDGESVANPASTSRRIFGPATVEFTIWADGGIDAEVTRAARSGLIHSNREW